MVIVFISAGVIVKNTEEKRILHGFLVNFLNALWISIIKVLFFSTMVIYNFDFNKYPQDWHLFINAELYFLIMGPFTGAIMCMIFGLYSFLEGKRIDIEGKIA